MLNATGIPRLAARTARALARLGFDVTGTGDAAAASATTVTYSGQADSAYTLATALRAAPAAQNLLAEPDRPPGPGHADHRQRFRGRERALGAPARLRREGPARPQRAQRGRADCGAEP